MSAHEMNTLLEAVFWIALILSSPLLGKITYSLTYPMWGKIFDKVIPIWNKLTGKTNLELTFKKGNKTYTVVVDPKTDYLLELEKRLDKLGFNDAK